MTSRICDYCRDPIYFFQRKVVDNGKTLHRDCVCMRRHLQEDEWFRKAIEHFPEKMKESISKNCSMRFGSELIRFYLAWKRRGE